MASIDLGTVVSSTHARRVHGSPHGDPDAAIGV